MLLFVVQIQDFLVKNAELKTAYLIKQLYHQKVQFFCLFLCCNSDLSVGNSQAHFHRKPIYENQPNIPRAV